MVKRTFNETINSKLDNYIVGKIKCVRIAICIDIGIPTCFYMFVFKGMLRGYLPNQKDAFNPKLYCQVYWIIDGKVFITKKILLCIGYCICIDNPSIINLD